MKQTAIDWLVEKLKENGVNFWQEEIEMIEEAKEMEKNQIVDAFDDGFEEMPYKNGEHYYNENYKSE